MPSVILKEKQRVNIVVRGLAFLDGHLLVTQWRDNGAAFPIGGRVEFGEPIVESLRREVREETAPQADVKLTMAADDFVALYRNQLNPVQAFMGGKIKVSGNVGLVMQLLNWFDREA